MYPCEQRSEAKRPHAPGRHKRQRFGKSRAGGGAHSIITKEQATDSRRKCQDPDGPIDFIAPLRLDHIGRREQFRRQTFPSVQSHRTVSQPVPRLSAHAHRRRAIIVRMFLDSAGVTAAAAADVVIFACC